MKINSLIELVILVIDEGLARTFSEALIYLDIKEKETIYNVIDSYDKR